MRVSTSSHNFAGYRLGDTTEVHKTVSPPPIWLICGGVGAQWAGMLKQLSLHPLSQNILEDLTELLMKHSFDLMRLVESDDIRIFDDPKSLFVGLAVVQCIQVQEL